MITVFVGDIDNRTPYTLVTEYNKLQSNSSYYACLADFSNEKKFVDLLESVDQIFYSPPEIWSNIELEKETKKCLSFLEIFKNKRVDNFTNDSLYIENMLKLKDIRKTNNQQLWIAGCSFSEGVGVEDNQRYGELLAKELSLPVSFLAHRGCSNGWLKDQILRSDIRKKDILVWQLTFPNRLSYFWNEIIHVYPEAFTQRYELVDIVGPDRLTEQQTIYESLTSIMQVVNFCKLNSIDLYILGLAYNPTKYLKNLNNFIPIIEPGGNIKDHYKDIGNDHNHSGPLTHQWYKNLLITKINENGIH